MNPLPNPISSWRSAIRRYFARPKGWFVATMAIWWVLLAAFYAFPQLDLAVAQAFYVQAACPEGTTLGRICGSFPYGSQGIFVGIRQVLFYLPVAVGLYLLYQLVSNLRHHGEGYSAKKTRDYSIAFVSLLVGPYILVNLILKQFSDRPRPYQTDLFGGKMDFMAAGDFAGACVRNCSFISGEAAGAGWMACLIVLLPKSLRPVLGPPMIVISLISPALRTSFGGHYLSDVVLGWLSSVVVYAGVALCFEMSQRLRKENSPTHL